MVMRRVSDIRPHLVLECSFEQKRFGDKRERERRARVEEKSRFWWEIIVEYTKEQHVYQILVSSAHIYPIFCIRIGAFDRSRVFGLV